MYVLIIVTRDGFTILNCPTATDAQANLASVEGKFAGFLYYNGKLISSNVALDL